MYYYIINPAAGNGAINKIQEKLKTRLGELNIAGEFVKTTGPGDATKITRDAIEKGYTTIVAVGGDGTVNEVINGISKDSVAVGIIPIGNSNLIASHLGIKTWQSSLGALSARRLTSYGLIAAGQKFLLSTLRLGFETDIDKRVDIKQTGLAPRMKSLKESIGHARKFAPLECKIDVDDKYHLECNIFSLTVTNQKFNNPLAENKLVISISDMPSTPQLTSYVWSMLKNKSPIEERATTRFVASRIVIDTKPVTGITIDGKLAGRTPIAIRLTDRKIRFITEKTSSDFKP